MVPKDANVQVNLILLVCFTSLPHLFHVLRDNQDQIYLYAIRPNMKSTQPPSAPQFPSSAGPAAQTECCFFIYLLFWEAFYREDSDLCPGHQRFSAAVSFTRFYTVFTLVYSVAPFYCFQQVRPQSDAESRDILFLNSLGGWLRLRINATEASYSIFCVLDIKGSSTFGFLQLMWGYRNIVVSEFLRCIINSVFSYRCPFENVKTGCIKDKVLHELKELYTYLDDLMQRKK